MRKIYTPSSAAADTLQAIKLLDGRWKLLILFHLFDGKVQRYSDFEKLIPDISQKNTGAATQTARGRRNRSAQSLSTGAAKS